MKKLNLILVLAILIFTPLIVKAEMPTPIIVDKSYIEVKTISEDLDNNLDGYSDAYTTFTQINKTLIEIFVNDTRETNNYQWQSGVFNINKLNELHYQEYNPATQVWSPPIELNLYNYQWTTGWNVNGNTSGFALFGSGSGDKRYKLILPDNNPEFKIFTGQGSEEKVYVWVNETWLLYETNTYEREGFTIKVNCDGNYLDTYWYEILGTDKFLWDNSSAPYNNCTIEVWDDENALEFDSQRGIIKQKDEYRTYFDFNTGQFEKIRTNNPKYLNINDLLLAEENNITDTTITQENMGVIDCLEKFRFWNWDDFNVCLDDPKKFDLKVIGTIINTDPSLDEITDDTMGILDWQLSRTEVSNLGLRTDAPILYMNFNKDNESAGYVQDNSIYNNFGTNNGATWNSSCSALGDGCFEFDGVDDYVAVDNNDKFKLQEHTLSVWINADIIGVSGDYNGILETHMDGAAIGSRLRSRIMAYGAVSDIRYHPSYNPYTNIYVDFGDVSSGKWHLLTATWNGSVIKSYLDGEFVESSNFSGPIVYSESPDFVIGNDISTSSRLFDGSIDQVQIWDRALSASEVLELYNGSVSGYNNSDYIGKYARDGEFTSLVFHNDTSTYWNVTQSLADSNGTALTNISCQNDANCVSYWALDENYLDSKGSNDGTPTGTNNATGISSEAMRFDGVDDEVTVTGYPTKTSDYAVSFWFNPEREGNSDVLIDGIGIFIIYGWTGGHDVQARADDGTWFETGTNSIHANEWTHITIVDDDTATGSSYFYVNGQLTNSYGDGLKSIESTIRFGNDGGSNAYQGFIDEVLIYNDSLTASEVEELYKAGLSQHANTNVTLQTRVADSYNVSDTGLVGLWGLNGDATDETGVNNGSWSGSEAYTNGTVGDAGDFDGSTDYINLGSSVGDYEDNFTVSTWFKANADNTRLLSRRSSIAVQYDIHLKLNGGSLALYDGGLYETATDGLDDGKWHHGVIVINGASSQFYIDGLADGSTFTPSISSISIDTVIGAWRTDTTPSGYFNGQMDEVRIYNRSLSADEIQNLYELGSYHIEWGEWTDEGVKSDGVAKTSTSAGKFMQFKDVFETDDTDVSAYVLNYSVTTTEAPPVGDSTPPSVIIDSPLSQNYTETNSIDFNVTATDDGGIDTCIGTINNWDSNFTLNYTNSSVPNGEYIFNVSCNDTYGNINNTEFVYFNVSVQSMITPDITILFPLNTTYEIEPTNITFTVEFTEGEGICWYSQDNGTTNSTPISPMNYTGLNSVQGGNYQSLWCNNSEGTTTREDMYFNWSDTTNPSVSITYPINGNLYGTSPLSVTTIITDTNHDSSWTEFNGVNTTFSGNSTSLTITETGTYSLTVWVNDTFGNIASDSVGFDFAYHQDYPHTTGDFIQKWIIYNSTSMIYTNVSGVRIDGAYCNFVSGVCGS